MKQRNMAVDLGGTNVRVALADESLALTGRLAERTVLEDGPRGVVDQILRMTGHVLLDLHLTWNDVTCLAVASPGPLDPATGIVRTPSNLPGWEVVPLGEWLAEGTGVPVRVVNDANAAALGEFYAGVGQRHGVHVRNLVYLTISTGIGGGVVVEGSLLEGSNGAAAELGHLTLDCNGPRCRCGNIGCLEYLASGTAIARQFGQRLAAGERSIVTTWTDTPTAADVARGMAIGDPLAISVFTTAAEILGLGVVNCIHAFNPDLVVLGGGVTKSGDLLFDIVRRVVHEHAMEVSRSVVEVVPAQLGDNAGLTGAAVVARDFRARTSLRS